MTTGARLQDGIGTIMEAWLAEVKSQPLSNVAHSHSDIILRDGIPDLLHHIGRCLNREADSKEAIATHHGKQRADLYRYNLNDVIREYHLLQGIVVEHLTTNSAISTQDRSVIAECFEQAIELSSESFYQDRLQVQAEVQVPKDEVQAPETKNLNSLAQQHNLDEAARESFITGMVHDLKNPLAAISMAADLLVEEGGEQEVRLEMIRIIRRNLRDAQKMLHDLLDANLIKSGKNLPLRVTKVNLTKLLEEILKSKRQQIDLNCSERIFGYWDKSLIARAIENLVSNAIKYGDIRQPITVESNQNNHQTTVAVKNFGKPIPGKHLQAIFTNAYRADESTAKGWGLGLTIVNGVARSHKGGVSVTSSAETGTTFTLTFENDLRNSRLAEITSTAQ